MSRISNREYLYLVWKDYKTKNRYIIGELSKNGKYEFKYRIKELDNAINNGFEPLIAFANINEVYESYDVFELLKKSGGKLPIDSLEFVEPISLDEEILKVN